MAPVTKEAWSEQGPHGGGGLLGRAEPKRKGTHWNSTETTHTGRSGAPRGIRPLCGTRQRRGPWAPRKRNAVRRGRPDGTAATQRAFTSLTNGRERSTAVNPGTCRTGSGLTIRLDQYHLRQPTVLPKLAVLLVAAMVGTGLSGG